MADFSTKTGQERLGHELSHVMSQRSGAVRGEGFLASSSLEARADREGAMAAAGEPVYTGPVTHALSSASPSPAAAGPMQAKRGKKLTGEQLQANDDWEDNTLNAMEGSRERGHTDEELKRMEKVRQKRWAGMKKAMKPGAFYDLIEDTITSAKGLNGAGIDEIPQKYINWHAKHQRKKTRWSGKKGWGTQKEYEQRQAQMARLEEEEEERLRKLGIADEHEEVFI